MIFRGAIYLVNRGANSLSFSTLYDDFRPDDALLLGVLAYNCGPGVVNKSGVYRRLKSGNRDIYKSYTSHCRYKGKFHKQLHQRRITEYLILFRK